MASPPLVVAGAGSGGEASSGSEETGTAAPPGRDLGALFEQAAERLPALLPAASKEQLLYLYARYKQVKFGTCNTPKPSFFDFEGKQKWEAWKALGDISPHQAMQEYIATVKKLDPSWNPQTAEKRGKESKTAFGGPVVSSLYQEETIREEDKNIFDYCRENNIDYVTKAIRSKKVDVNVTDEEGRALLHWACDRGHKELVSVLLQHAADVNSQEDSMHRRKHKHQFIIYCSNPHWGRARRLMRDDVLFKFGTWKRKRMALNSNIDERTKPKNALNFRFLSFYYFGSK
ncbi:acyl-CoA-binding domain-containing protein 6 isoform X1 [Rissa tridactyla]|uniref:acyl-CoA-binding domain-containing protein 6 isoform X1 n=1 Tax=Rissa tridactyla TaxID=75485 RepID=UPI0023BA6AA1|nr:acyl-CoA-binding domain-containing protein 6 isoform X1 [Rissa tridactyla]